jgi:hypothetical protein
MRYYILCTIIILYGCLARPLVKKTDSEKHLQQSRLLIIRPR